MNKTTNNKLHLEYVANCICFGPLTSEDKEALASKGLSITAIPVQVYSIELNYFNRLCHGIGMRNDRGGIEFINFESMNHPITIHSKGITVVRSGRLKSHGCCIFANFLDFLAYCTMSAQKSTELPRNQDCIICNHPRNCMYFIMESEFYGEINLFLPKSNAGKILAKTIMSRNSITKDWSSIYGQYKSLRVFLKRDRENKGNKQ